MIFFVKTVFLKHFCGKTRGIPNFQCAKPVGSMWKERATLDKREVGRMQNEE